MEYLYEVFQTIAHYAVTIIFIILVVGWVVQLILLRIRISQPERRIWVRLNGVEQLVKEVDLLDAGYTVLVSDDGPYYPRQPEYTEIEPTPVGEWVEVYGKGD